MNLLDFIFPKSCLECRVGNRYICERCLKKVPYGNSVYLEGSLVKSVWSYSGVIRKAIVALKYKYAMDVAMELIEDVNLSERIDCLVPIPSHWHKKNIRGFNQTEILGEQLAKKIDCKWFPDLLVKKYETMPQVGLNSETRHQNIHGTFAVNPFCENLPKTSSICIFDDVLTTGSTLSEAFKVLKNEGFTNLSGLTLAKQF